MRVLVTGANGFVGREIVSELLREAHEVHCIVSPDSRVSNYLPNIRRLDISNDSHFHTLEKLVRAGSFDTVIHCAGLAHQFGNTSKEKFWGVNVFGSENVANCSVKLGIKQFILISSVSVYGKNRLNGIPIDETFQCRPQTFYGQSKLESEEVVSEICAKNEIGLTILRLATVIGENDRGNTQRLIEAIDTKKFVFIGTGENRKSLIYKTDVGRACGSVLQKKDSEIEIFNVTNKAVKMKDIVSEIAANLKIKLPKLRIPVAMVKFGAKINSETMKFDKISKLAETVEKWVSEDVFTGEKIAIQYGFRPEISIPEAIARQVKAYRLKKNITEND